jgi:hypothetical protein
MSPVTLYNYFIITILAQKAQLVERNSEDV